MPESNFNSLIRACKYSLIPNELGYCGPEGSFEEFLKFIKAPSTEGAEIVKPLLQQFNALFPYLELIARCNDLEPFNEQVIEAYWVGNSLLESVSKRELQKTVLLFQTLGLPRSIAERKAAELPTDLLPHHSFHVLYVNFISQKVKPIVKNLGECIVQRAKVVEETDKGIVANGITLFSESGELKLREKERTLKNPFELELTKGDLISVHWGNAVEKISEEQTKQLKKYTELTLSTLSQ
ncbi:MAG: DUF6390 family protein [archaeon]|nr:DUF6390 family protein [archaeon]